MADPRFDEFLKRYQQTAFDNDPEAETVGDWQDLYNIDPEVPDDVREGLLEKGHGPPACFLLACLNIPGNDHVQPYRVQRTAKTSTQSCSASRPHVYLFDTC